MRAFILYTILILSTLQIKAQLNAADTLNQTDSINKKQGYWIIYSTYSNSSAYAINYKQQEGRYKNNLKTGLWKEYYYTGNIKNCINFENGKPHGSIKIYSENGELREEGVWEKNKWIEYKIYKDEKAQLNNRLLYNNKTEMIIFPINDSLQKSNLMKNIIDFPINKKVEKTPETDLIEELNKK
jgi:hypothetical protein